MRRLTLLFAALGLLSLGAESDQPQKWDFEDASAGELPLRWSTAKSGRGPGSVWKVEVDDSAPSGTHTLGQTSSAGAGPLFNLCVVDGSSYEDLDLRVSLKPVQGKIDQGGGLVWRYRDQDNYYLARVNPLEDNFRLYKVVSGQRTQLATADVKAAAGKWHTMRIVQRGERIECYLGDKRYLEAKDSAFSDAGQIGLWTKADAVTRFDDFTVAQPAEKEPADTQTAEDNEASPRQVYVVNTGDASVSLVDLQTMKELKRFPVGARPYGIAVTRDGQTVAVGVEDEEKVKFFKAADFSLQAAVPIGKMFNDHIVLTQDGRRLLVADFYSDDVFVIDVAQRKESGRISGLSAPHVVKYGPLRQNAFVTCKKVLGIGVIDPVQGTVVKVHPLNVNPRSLTFSPDESKVYFGSFWVDGFFELDTATGKVTRLFKLDPPSENAAPQEVTYHGVEAIGGNIVLAANEGRSYIDAVDVTTGALLDRLTEVAKPCCIERIPGPAGAPVRVLVSNLGDGTLQLVEVSAEGKLKSLGKADVGKAPKRVAFVPLPQE